MAFLHPNIDLSGVRVSTLIEELIKQVGEEPNSEEEEEDGEDEEGSSDNDEEGARTGDDDMLPNQE
uniref:Uncharacterized protein n=1 Tax=Nelumbo nucifera TaxID=4432 RepID=A0A822ZP38_NELNU|nr:TPA_asm: hypothetical protein HUJ06_016939 [Nelumbo nucifera]